MPLLRDDYCKTEVINGIVYNMSPSSGFLHTQITGNLYYAIRSMLKDSICFVSIENLDLHLSENDYVIPDIMVICDRNNVKKNKYHGIPQFVAETLSPSTSFRDRGLKKEKYAALGIDEYWILSPFERSVEVYYLENKDYKLAASHILVDDKEDEDYNAEIILTLRSLPTVSIMLKSIFENIDENSRE